MPKEKKQDKRFGDIAVDLAMVSQAKVDRAVLVQSCIFSRTKVHMPIGKVLVEMGLLTQEQVDEVLKTQKELGAAPPNENQSKKEASNKKSSVKEIIPGLHLTISSDKLSAYLTPTGIDPEGVTLDAVKAFLKDRGVVYGLVEDRVLADYLARKPLPDEPFKVAGGIGHIPGKPSEVIYHFDTDPLRIGTLQADGTMDWKNRGEIPQCEEGDLLVEKTGGDPGQPGMSVFGKEIKPPRIREPQLKCAKGAQRSEDGRQIIAKIQGTPKVNSDGKISVFGMLPVKGDIGVETGNIDFNGFIETSGGVSAGYRVKGKGLRTTEIQEATIEISEDVHCYGGIYSSTLTVGGDLKASHLLNCRIEALGDVVVEKEMIGCDIETNGRCVIGDGKILDCRIDAKKGIQAKDIGAEAAKPSELTVGFDRKYERDMAALKQESTSLAQQKIDTGKLLNEIGKQSETIATQLGHLAKEQESFTAQQRQFQEQLNGEGPNAVKDDEEKAMLLEMIAELDEKNEAFEEKAQALKAQEEKIRLQLIDLKKSYEAMDGEIAACKEQMEALEEASKLDPGVPVVKVSGSLCTKTKIIAPFKEMTIPKTLNGVRVAEIHVEGSAKHQIKISPLK